MMKNFIKKLLRKKGMQIVPFPTPFNADVLRRMKIVNHFKIDVLLDVGANRGQYSKKMREYGFEKKIISFEPLISAFENLKKASENDSNWHINNFALGDEDITSSINISENSYSSSILNILPGHLASAPESKYVSKQDIKIKKLDSIFNAITKTNDRVMLKIDTQGYEKNVIDGSVESLKNIIIIQQEMSIVPLYEHEMLLAEMLQYLDTKGFELFALENGFSDEASGQLLQVDGIFVNKNFI